MNRWKLVALYGSCALLACSLWYAHKREYRIVPVKAQTSGLPSTIPSASGSTAVANVCNAMSGLTSNGQTGLIDDTTLNSGNTLSKCRSGVVVPPFMEPVTYYLNGVAQTGARCDFLTGTTNSSGNITFNISGMGYTTIIGQPQPATINASGPVLLTTTASSTTSISMNAQSGAVVSILSFSVTIFSNANALPVSEYVCGV